MREETKRACRSVVRRLNPFFTTRICGLMLVCALRVAAKAGRVLFVLLFIAVLFSPNFRVLFRWLERGNEPLTFKGLAEKKA